ncbi:hypothetical protein KJ761_02010 [Patescibacteria group bacterium]|nr:hypothetical protein [Patescibacteria group bacterium]
MNQKISTGFAIVVIILIAVIFGFIFWFGDEDDRVRIPEGYDYSKPLKKLFSPISTKCGMENCHGLDITCGPNIPEMCDEMFAAGDGCRQYASCQVIDGQCRLEKSSEFDSCKYCIEKCEIDYPNDLSNSFECESKCTVNSSDFSRNDPQACTEEAKVCPDGSSVVRTGPNCGFAACPGIPNDPMVGNDVDEHGCIGSAGYIWCEAKQKCLRTWEEKCQK